MRYKIMYWGCSSKSAFGISEVSDMCFTNCSCGITKGEIIEQRKCIVKKVKAGR